MITQAGSGNAVEKPAVPSPHDELAAAQRLPRESEAWSKVRLFRTSGRFVAARTAEHTRRKRTLVHIRHHEACVGPRRRSASRHRYFENLACPEVRAISLNVVE